MEGNGNFSAPVPNVGGFTPLEDGEGGLKVSRKALPFDVASSLSLSDLPVSSIVVVSEVAAVGATATGLFFAPKGEKTPALTLRPDDKVLFSSFFSSFFSSLIAASSSFPPLIFTELSTSMALSPVASWD